MVKNLIEWDNTKYSVGVNSIDEQHRRLVDLINQLNTVVHESPNDKPAITKVFLALKDYTVRHFQNEESLMEKAKYSNITEHKAKHKDLIAKVLDYEKRFAAGENVAQALLAVLKTWLLIHITIDDKGYSTSMKQAGVV